MFSGLPIALASVKMTETVAAILAQKYKSPEALEHILITESRRPLKERAAIMAVKTQPSGNSDKDAEAKILSDFEKSTKLLELRKRFYWEFRKILSPIQIQKMYDAERDSAASTR